jgi:hypothetical protein
MARFDASQGRKERVKVRPQSLWKLEPLKLWLASGPVQG